MTRATDAVRKLSYISADLNYYERNATWTLAFAQVAEPSSLVAACNQTDWLSRVDAEIQ